MQNCLLIQMKNTRILWLLVYVLTVWLFVGGSVAKAQQHIANLSRVYVDSASVLTIQEVANPRFQSKFAKFTQSIESQTFTPYTYWIRFTAPAAGNYFIASANTFIDYLTLYTPQATGWATTQNGLLQLHKTGHSSLTLQLPNEAAGQVCYLRVQSGCISKLDIFLLEQHELTAGENYKLSFFAVVILVTLAYFLAVLFLFVVTKQKGLLLVALYTLVTIVMALFTSGFLYQFLPPMPLWFYKWSFVYVVDVYWATSALLSFALLKVKKIGGGIVLVFYAGIGILVALMFTPWLLNRQLVTQIHFIIPTLFILFNLSIGTYLSITKKIQEAFYLSLGWLYYFFTLVVWTLASTSVIPITFFTKNAPATGIILEFAIFAVIAARYYLLKQEKSAQMQQQIEGLNEQRLAIKNKYEARYLSLSNREKEVLALLSEGALDKEIADQLNIALPSVRTYTKRIYDKLDVSNRTEASVIYNNLRLIDRLFS